MQLRTGKDISALTLLTTDKIAALRTAAISTLVAGTAQARKDSSLLKLEFDERYASLTENECLAAQKGWKVEALAGELRTKVLYFKTLNKTTVISCEVATVGPVSNAVRQQVDNRLRTDRDTIIPEFFESNNPIYG